MSKSPASKSKPPWIPAGKMTYRKKKTPKPQPGSKNVVADVSPKKVTIVSKDDNRMVEKENYPIDSMSVSSSSSYDGQNEPDIHLFSIYQEMKLLYVHFASLKTSYLSAHRPFIASDVEKISDLLTSSSLQNSSTSQHHNSALFLCCTLIDIQNVEDININEMLMETGTFIKEVNDLFDDLEFSVSVVENTLEDSLKTQEYAKVFKCKEKLLSRFLDMYEKVIIIFSTVFEKQDFKEMSEVQESLSRKLTLTEKKSISQEAVIKDLERRLSIYQSKSNAMESYKTNLEASKSELERLLSHKESQIKYLSDELLNVSGKQMKADHEELIEIIEGIKVKSQTEKSGLKKAIKFQKTQIKESEQKFQKLTEELTEKDKMMFDIATQRDHLKVQLTVVSNSVIQQKNQIEEMKIQNLKLQNEMSERELSGKKELKELQYTLEEKITLFENILKSKKKLENTIDELENELEASKKQIKKLKEEIGNVTPTSFLKHEDSSFLYEEMHRLITLLQSTKEVFENLKASSHVVSASGDHSADGMDWISAQNEVLAAVRETKQHLVELKNLYKTFLQGQKEKEGTVERSIPKKNDLEKQIKKLENLYAASMRENKALKAEIEDLRNVSVSSYAAQHTEKSYITTNMPSDNFTRKLQLELMKKSDELVKVKNDFQQREKDLESQLKENRDKVKSLETDSTKMSNLEEELKAHKAELSVIRQRKEEISYENYLSKGNLHMDGSEPKLNQLQDSSVEDEFWKWLCTKLGYRASLTENKRIRRLPGFENFGVGRYETICPSVEILLLQCIWWLLTVMSS